MFNSDGDLDFRISYAKEKAEKIIEGRYESYAECVMVLRWAICEYRNIPLWSDYFENLTLEQLVFEHELIMLSRQSPEDKAQNLAENNPEEMQDLFSDWAEEDNRTPAQVSKEWVDTTPKTPVMSEDELAAEERRFMKSGEFKEP